VGVIRRSWGGVLFVVLVVGGSTVKVVLLLVWRSNVVGLHVFFVVFVGMGAFVVVGVVTVFLVVVVVLLTVIALGFHFSCSLDLFLFFCFLSMVRRLELPTASAWHAQSESADLSAR